MDAFHRQALDILRSDATRNAFNLNAETQATRTRYGTTPFGQGALAARRLVQAGVRFVTVTLGGWDTHSNNFTSLRTRLLPPVDQTLSALIEDLDSRGMLDSTIVYCAGEFNRTPRINPAPAATTGRGRWRLSWLVAVSAAVTRTARPTPTAWPRLPTPAPRMTWPRPSSRTWASTRTTS
jgi:uncharacterized protein (DUF1501 family)